MRKRLLFLMFGACGHACAMAAPPPVAQNLTLSAAAADAGAAVFADGATLYKVGVGEWLPGGAWRVEAVRRGSVVLKSSRKLDDSDLRMQVPVGGRVAADAMAPIDAMHKPFPYPQITTHVDDGSPPTDR